MNSLLCIGCDNYDDSSHFPRLNAAERDARKVHEALVGSDSVYEKSTSILLVSPTHAEVIQALEAILWPSGDLDTLTIFFAGHAFVARGSLYLCIKDTDATRPSFTALSIPQLFSMITDAKPRTVNIVVDACQAGGSAFDLSSLVKSELAEQSMGPSVCFLGACTATQVAQEAPSGGALTNELLTVVTGERSIQSERKWLDLVELGQFVAEALTDNSEGDQIPVTWAIGLCGYGQFATNKHYRPTSEGQTPLFPVDHISPDSVVGKIIYSESDKFWAHTRSISDHWEPSVFHRDVESLLERIAWDPNAQALFVYSLTRGMCVQARAATDLLAESEIIACCAFSLLPYIDQPVVLRTAEVLLDRWLAATDIAIQRLNGVLREDRSPLIEGMFGEFHYTPLKVTKTLAWLASIALIRRKHGRSSFGDIDETTSLLLARYYGCCIAVSEIQAPWVMLFFECGKGVVDDQLRLRVLERFMGSLFEVKGKVLALDAPPLDIVRYTLYRGGCDLEIPPRSLARPSELLSALLWACLRWNRSTYETQLRQLDHRTLGAFVPQRITAFGLTQMPNGMNINEAVGLSIYTLTDFDRVFRQRVLGLSREACADAPSTVLLLAALSSLILSDRTAFFLDTSEP